MAAVILQFPAPKRDQESVLDAALVAALGDWLNGTTRMVLDGPLLKMINPADLRVLGSAVDLATSPLDVGDLRKALWCVTDLAHVLRRARGETKPPRKAKAKA